VFVLARLSPSFSLNQVAGAKTAVASGPIGKQLSPILLGSIKWVSLADKTSSQRLNQQQHVDRIRSHPHPFWIASGCILPG